MQICDALRSSELARSASSLESCPGRQREGETERERERQRDRETERQRDRETERQRDRETERQRDRETERQRSERESRESVSVRVREIWRTEGAPWGDRREGEGKEEEGKGGAGGRETDGHVWSTFFIQTFLLQGP